MKLVFPTWEPKGKNQIQEINQTAGEIKPASTPAENELRYRISPQQVVQLDAEHAVMITGSALVDQTGEVAGGHASSGIISAFWFKKDKDLWTFLDQQDEVTTAGKYGEPEETKVIRLDQTHFALAIESSDCFQGQCFTSLNLYQIGPTEIKPLFSKYIRLSEGNLESRDCEAAMNQPIGKTIERKIEEDHFSSHECYDIKGMWHIDGKGNQPGDLIIEFSGQKEHQVELNREDGATENDPVQITIQSTLNEIKQKQVLRYKNGQYHLVSGKNPNPNQ
ncbi:hypothetical protein HQ393_07060 [Chitinibacter bivalviorum]|uniref:Uncharacterized protein n=1 Tax=Chitinibacter bivalviorum TaxID=2739434 RepID=A0A7H9BIJ3_9NEIS|nr:hypothetical protein [Chitinibacter bivalviorum]QLG88038.1 hypothetical protein HQ393_07060 [Chitinibacter bivalviorum]